MKSVTGAIDRAPDGSAMGVLRPLATASMQARSATILSMVSVFSSGVDFFGVYGNRLSGPLDEPTTIGLSKYRAADKFQGTNSTNSEKDPGSSDEDFDLLSVLRRSDKSGGRVWAPRERREHRHSICLDCGLQTGDIRLLSNRSIGVAARPHNTAESQSIGSN